MRNRTVMFVLLVGAVAGWCTPAGAGVDVGAPPPPPVSMGAVVAAAGNAAVWVAQIAALPPEPPPAPVTAPRRPRRTTGDPGRSGGTHTTGTVNGYPCGGDLPPCCVLRGESGGNPTARNSHSSASGLWQFLDSTWGGFGGYESAWMAPPDVQNEHARITWAGGAGASHWRATMC